MRKPISFKIEGTERYDWEKVKMYFIRSKDVSLKDLAKVEGAPSLAAISKKAASERWVQEKDVYWANVAKQAMSNISAMDASFLEKTAKVGRNLVNLGEGFLANSGTHDWTAKDAVTMIVKGTDLQRVALGYDRVGEQAAKMYEQKLAEMLHVIEDEFAFEPDTFNRVVRALKGHFTESQVLEGYNADTGISDGVSN